MIPMQPWGKRLLPHVNMKSLVATHLDWYMLAFMQWGAAFIMWRWPAMAQMWVAWLWHQRLCDGWCGSYE